MLREESAAVLLGEKSVEAPLALGFRADVEQIDDEEIAGLRALHADRPRQEMDDRQIDVAHIGGVVVVLDEAAGPIIGLDYEIIAGLHPGHHWNVRMPTVVNHVVFISRLGQIDLDQCFGHFRFPSWLSRSHRQEICYFCLVHRRPIFLMDDFAIFEHQHAIR